MAGIVEVLIITVYGGSALIAGGAGIAWLVSRRFRKSLIGDQAAR
jgi:hypothetical protein